MAMAGMAAMAAVAGKASAGLATGSRAMSATIAGNRPGDLIGEGGA
jgi:hypothetical protein